MLEITFAVMCSIVRVNYPHLMLTASSMVSGNGTFFVSGTSKYKALARSSKPDVIKHGCKTLPDSPEEHIIHITLGILQITF